MTSHRSKVLPGVNTVRLALLTALIGLASGCGRGAPEPAAPQASVLICGDGEALEGGACRASAPPPRASASAPVAARIERAEIDQARGELSAEELVGVWHGNDSNGWASYELSLRRDGSFTQNITTLDPTSGRAPGTCHQQGASWLEGEMLFMRYDVNDCNSSYEGQTSSDRLTRQSQRSFTLDMSGYTVEYTRLR